MPSRKQLIEGIIENMQTIKRQIISRGSIKSDTVGITHSQWAVLSIVMEKEKVGVKEIAGLLRISSSAATQLIDGLVINNVLVRQSDTSDRRALLLKISEEYKKKLGALRANATEQFSSMFEALSDNELEQYSSLNKKIVESFNIKK